MTKPYSLNLAIAQLRGWLRGDGPLGCGGVAGGRFERREVVAALSCDGQRGAWQNGGNRQRVLIGEHRAWLLARIAGGSDMTLRGLVANGPNGASR